MKTAELKPPDQAEREYTRLLQWLTRRMAQHTRQIVIPKLPAISADASATLTQDGWSEDIATVLLALMAAISADARVVESKLPGVFALLSKTNDRALTMAVKASTGVQLPPVIPGVRRSPLGVDIYRAEPWWADMQTAWIRQNVSLVESIQSQYHGQLETIIREGVFQGESVRSISKKIEHQFGVSKNRATLIAQDQILGANARLTQIRAESLGVESYEWATVGDSRVRPEHAELNGRTFTWKKPPAVGHPGTPIRCRCRARLILPELD